MSSQQPTLNASSSQAEDALDRTHTQLSGTTVGTPGAGDSESSTEKSRTQRAISTAASFGKRVVRAALDPSPSSGSGF
ncbi:uncharacterized protein I206_100836 [Kwoniella pini CBS 10737]|uniref:Uncharacterized protein n=1 Tax=Kwoniella pini CBS 10737 TaxID=1296096 RepID=A0A1B9IC50_9TREE|nr:uncharacterized protein I206_00490 [Kwoniella pini CBS 10737]OCF53189.1 hypothetical protein I206_00490 [Kwoniella pini CBS 10737]